jgi:ABC-type uncharacterized transport system permease subunit
MSAQKEICKELKIIQEASMKGMVIGLLVAMAVIMTGCAIRFEIQKVNKVDSCAGKLFAYNWRGNSIYLA